MQFISSIIHLLFIFKGQVPWPALTFRSKANFFTISNALTIFARIICRNFRSLFVFDSIFLAVAQSVAQRSLRNKQCRIHQNQDKYQNDLHVATQIIKLIFLHGKTGFQHKNYEFLPFFQVDCFACFALQNYFKRNNFPKNHATFTQSSVISKKKI